MKRRHTGLRERTGAVQGVKPPAPAASGTAPVAALTPTKRVPPGQAKIKKVGKK